MRRLWALGLTPLCSLTVLAAIIGSWRMVPDLALRLPVPPAALVTATPGVPDPVVVQAWVPFTYDDASSTLQERVVCIANKAGVVLPPLLEPVPVSTP